MKRARKFMRGKLSQGEWGARLRRSRPLVGKWETGEREPQDSDIELASDISGIPLDWFYDGKPTPPPEPAARRADTQEGPRKGLRAEPSGKIKIYSSASAGDGNSSSPDLDELDVPQQFARDDYGALIVEGRSMEPFLEHGDTAIFRDWHEPKPGYVMAVSNEYGEWLIKLVQSSGKLKSLNTGYEPLEGQFRFHGFLVGIVRDTGPERMIRLNPFGLKPEVRG